MYESVGFLNGKVKGGIWIMNRIADTDVCGVEEKSVHVLLGALNLSGCV